MSENKLAMELVEPAKGKIVAPQEIDASSVIKATAVDVNKPTPLSKWAGSLARQDPDAEYFIVAAAGNAGAVYYGGISGMNPTTPTSSTNPVVSFTPINIHAGQVETTYLMFTTAGDSVYLVKGTSSGGGYGQVVAGESYYAPITLP